MLTPSETFAGANALALLGWIAPALSVFAPRLRRFAWPITGLALPAAFALAYVGSLAAGLANGGGGGFGSIAEVRTLFADDHALTAGWLHYLAFDLIVGTLIARDAARAATPAAFVLPALALTFLFGRAGLLTHLVVRLAQGGRLEESLS